MQSYTVLYNYIKTFRVNLHLIRGGPCSCALSWDRGGGGARAEPFSILLHTQTFLECSFEQNVPGFKDGSTVPLNPQGSFAALNVRLYRPWNQGEDRSQVSWGGEELQG